ncbi:MAG: hypothetical protein IJU24_07455 [Bacteroidaceae bacterium]|nr:hypothetical protein [Bacteroidaceae bacterium]
MRPITKSETPLNNISDSNVNGSIVKISTSSPNSDIISSSSSMKINDLMNRYNPEKIKRMESHDCLLFLQRYISEYTMIANNTQKARHNAINLIIDSV